MAVTCFFNNILLFNMIELCFQFRKTNGNDISYICDDFHILAQSIY